MTTIGDKRERSPKPLVKSGVSQRSVHGPPLFLVYKNVPHMSRIRKTSKYENVTKLKGNAAFSAAVESLKNMISNESVNDHRDGKCR